jgi:hypothetical protein
VRDLHVFWKATETAAASALKLAKTPLARIPRFVEAEQLPNVLMPGVHCVKRPNWKLKGKGHKMIERCIDHFGIDVVAQTTRRCLWHNVVVVLQLYLTPLGRRRRWARRRQCSASTADVSVP